VYIYIYIYTSSFLKLGQWEKVWTANQTGSFDHLYPIGLEPEFFLLIVVRVLGIICSVDRYGRWNGKKLNANERKENKGAEKLTTMAFIHRTHASTEGMQITICGVIQKNSKQ
jgi:hypothetical protein